MAFEPENAPLEVLKCATKHGLSALKIEHAWRSAVAMRYRDFTIPSVIAAAGVDSHHRLIEMLGAEQESGAIVVFHAMQLTEKMANELGL